MSPSTHVRCRCFVIARLFTLVVFVGCSGGSGGGPPAPEVPPTEALPDSTAEAVVTAFSAREALEAMETGRLSSEEYVSRLLDRIERYPELNAVIAMDAEAALAAAREADEARAAGENLGPLHGLPILAKDSINTQELPTTAGTPSLADNQPDENAPALQRLLDAGAILLGKSNLHELSLGFTTNNAFTGPTRNPYDSDRVAGGSSGGNGAALAARLVPLALGEDTSGSVRVPSALTGVAGFRPTTGRYPSAGVVPIAPTLDTLGPMARTAADLALADAVLAGGAPAPGPAALAQLRLGVPRRFFQDGLSEDVAAAIEETLDRLRDGGVTLVEADLPVAGTSTADAAFAITLFEFSEAMAGYLDAWAPDLTVSDLAGRIASPDVQFQVSLAVASNPVAPADYGAIVEGLVPQARQALVAYLRDRDLDALLVPTVAAPAPRLGQMEVNIGESSVAVSNLYFRLGHYAALVGAPALTLPIGQLSDGLPAGAIDLVGAPGDDRELLAAGLAVEELLPTVAPPGDITPTPDR